MKKTHDPFIYMADSSADTNEEILSYVNIVKAPLHIMLEDEHYIDDGSIDIIRLLAKINISTAVPKTAAPSPADFLKHTQDSTAPVFITTLSSRLSGTYNAAMLAAKTLQEQNRDVHVFDSKSAATAETLILKKCKEYADEGLGFSEIVEKVEDFISDLQTFFLLDDIKPLMKNGRMSRLTGRLAQLLLIKPILCGNREGEIALYDKMRSTRKALERMGDIIAQTPKKAEECDLFIDHCNCLQRAQMLKDYIESRRKFRRIYITHTGGLSSVYAAQGGIICTF